MSIYSVFAEPVVDADPALCTIEEADNNMRQFPQWMILSDEAKAEEIVSASKVISDYAEYYGDPVEDDQPLAFPRIVTGAENTFGNAGQRRNVLKAMIALISYRLGQVLPGIERASLGDESVSHRGAQIPHEVRGHLWPYIRQ